LWARDSLISPQSDEYGPLIHDLYGGIARRNNIAYTPVGMSYGLLYSLERRPTVRLQWILIAKVYP